MHDTVFALFKPGCWRFDVCRFHLCTCKQSAQTEDFVGPLEKTCCPFWWHVLHPHTHTQTHTHTHTHTHKTMKREAYSDIFYQKWKLNYKAIFVCEHHFLVVVLLAWEFALGCCIVSSRPYKSGHTSPLWYLGVVGNSFEVVIMEWLTYYFIATVGLWVGVGWMDVCESG